MAPFIDEVRSHQAQIDLAVCERIISMCEWILNTSTRPDTVQWAADELGYFQQRAASDRGLILNP